VRRKEQILLEHCAAVGRDPDEIERTAGFGMPLIRDNRAEAERVLREAFARNRVAWTQTDDLPVGTPEDVAELLAPYIELGYRHLIGRFPSPYDEESMTRLVTDVQPLLERS
jgi:alkanesulfonate monooxygenase SsuD/methylene tetrahydromethanopterin reductase-like flavin-dependent oxidoreductase (luciferase family)